MLRPSLEVRPRADWLYRSAVCGYFAAIAMLILLGAAYTLLLLITQGVSSHASWIHILADNTLTASASSSPLIAAAFHVLVGVAFATAYGGWVEPRLAGPHWRKGLLFAFLPCLLSLLVFFPLAGAGFMGFSLGAGPLPIAGNLVLHGLYGLTLGLLYGPLMDSEWAGPSGHSRAHVRKMVAGTFRGAARGIVVGTLIGLLGAPLVIALLMPESQALHLSRAWIQMSTILVASTLGCLVGLLSGQNTRHDKAPSVQVEPSTDPLPVI